MDTHPRSPRLARSSLQGLSVDTVMLSVPSWVLCPAPTPSGWHICPGQEGLSSSELDCVHIPSPIRRGVHSEVLSKVFPHVYCLHQEGRGSALLCPLAREVDDAAVFALCYGLRTCSTPY